MKRSGLGKVSRNLLFNPPELIGIWPWFLYRKGILILFLLEERYD